MTSLEQAMATALAHHRAGQVSLAEPIYRQVLQTNPAHAPALHYLGLIAHAAGHHPDALELVRQSVELSPQNPDFLNNYGIVLRAAGKLPEAIAQFGAAVERRADFAEAWSNLGNALRLADRNDEAIEACETALRYRPDSAEAMNNLGAALNKVGRHAESLPTLQRAVARKPMLAEAHANLGTALKELGRIDEAEASAREALRLQPDYVDARVLLAIILHRKLKLSESIACFEGAIAQQPGNAHAYIGYGNVLLHSARADDAIAAFRSAIEHAPESVEAHNNLGYALQQIGDYDSAAAAYHKALQLRPGDPEVRGNRSLLLLLRGDFKRGWGEYEWRHKSNEFGKARTFTQPRWDGSDLAGKTILLHAEQGLGDTIQFLRYAPLVKAKGARVVVEAQRELADLAPTCGGIDATIARPDPLPPFDVHCPLLSLPLVFRTDASSIPASIPYLHVLPEKLEQWREKLGPRRSRLRVAIAWGGNPAHRLNHLRTIPMMKMIEPLMSLQDVELISIQKGASAEELQHAPLTVRDRIRDFGPHLTTFGDTAALLKHVDVLVSVDTSAVHLAGAIGVPVWTLIAHSPDFRWMLNREDSPWYPTMRLLRQPRPGDWDSVLARVVRELGDIDTTPSPRPQS